MRLKLTRPTRVLGASGLALSALTAVAASAAGTAQAAVGPTTATPIKHVAVIILENHSFDNVFATYQPPYHQHIWNLLSEGIINKNGSPGPTPRT